MKKIAQSHSTYQGFQPYSGAYGKGAGPHCEKSSDAGRASAAHGADVSIEGTTRQQLDQLSSDIVAARDKVGEAEELKDTRSAIRSQVENLSERLRTQLRDGVPGAEERALEFNQTLVLGSDAKMKQRRDMWFNKSVPVLESPTLYNGFIADLPTAKLQQCVALALRNHSLSSGIKANAGFVTNPHQARVAIAFITHDYAVFNNDYLSGLDGIQTAAHADVSVALCEKGYSAQGKRLFDDVSKIRTDQQARVAIGFINNKESNPILRAVEILSVAD